MELEKILEEFISKVNMSKIPDEDKYKFYRDCIRSIDEESKKLINNSSDNIGYLDLAANKLSEDAFKYIDNYIRKHSINMYGSVISISKSSARSDRMRLYVSMPEEKRYINWKGLTTNIFGFRSSTVVTDLLEIEKTTVITEKQYKKFMDITNDNEYYFLPYIADILYSLNNMYPYKTYYKK